MFQPLFVRQLTPGEREFLAGCAKSTNKEEAWRAEVILLSAEGKTAAEISEALGFHSSNIKKWIRKFNIDGINGIAAKKRGPQGGPRPNFSSDQVEKLLALSKTHPPTLGYVFKEWTPQKLASAAIERGIVERISQVTVRQILKRNGSSPRVGRPLTSSGTKLLKLEGDDGPGRYFLEKGKEAFSNYSHNEAVEYLNAAIDAGIGSNENEAIARILLSKALEEISQYNEAAAVTSKYEDHQTLAQLSPWTRAHIRLRIGSALGWLRNAPKAIASLNEAKKLFHELHDELGLSETHCILGCTYLRIEEFRIARDHLLAAAGFQKKYSDKELLARIYDRLGVTDFREGAFSSAKENYLKALSFAEDSADLKLRGMILVNLGTTIDEGYLGEREQSADYIKRAIEYLSNGGENDRIAVAYNNLAANLRESGLWDEAAESARKGIEVARRFKEPSYEATARITLAEILTSKGRFAEAEENLLLSLDLIKSSVDKWAESNALRILASVHRGLGRTEEALKCLRSALSLATSIGDLHGATLAHIGLVEFHFQQGSHDQAREYLELAQARLKEEKSLFLSGLIQRFAGQLEAACGRFAEAKQHIAQSISIFTTTKIPYETARSHYEMGMLLKTARDFTGAEINLVQAKEVFQRVGAALDLQMALKSLDSLASGTERGINIARVTAANDVLLMQRLIEASASRELLLQELAAVIYENFSADAVIISVTDWAKPAEALVSKGITIAAANMICCKWEAADVQSGRHPDGTILTRIGNGGNLSVLLYIASSETFDLARLQPLLKQVELGLETCSLRSSATMLHKPKFDHRVQTIIPGFICCSSQMFDVIGKIQKIRTSDVTVLITGESGTGKELVARAVHQESARARAIFLPFNCTATPKEIIDSQLFGHRRGAFTGATANYPGIIKAADGGTLFLDEIGDLSLEVQPKLMRFLQESEIQPLGETKPLRVDVRVLAATNTDLERAVEDGRFREDLFHRLNIIRIHVPPLRERREEVGVLAPHFLDHFASRSGKQGITLTQDAIDALTDYDWPGNVRQLRNEIERVVAYASDSARISPEDLSPEVARPRKQTAVGRLRAYDDRASSFRDRDERSNNGSNGRADHYHLNGNHSNGNGRVKLKEATAMLERQIIEESLMRNKNNLTRTAIDVGLSRRGLRLKLMQLGIGRPE